MRRFTSLGRSIVPWHGATAWALTASSITFVAAGIAHGPSSGARGAAAAFLAWAIVRELAPRRALASLIVPFAAIAFAIPARTDLLACFVVLLAARIALRSVGDPPTRLDALVLLALTAWAATSPTALPVALVLAAACFADAPPPSSRALGASMLVVAVVVGSVEGTLTVRFGWDDHALAAQVLLAIVAACALVLVAWPLPQRLRVRDDRDRGPLDGRRLRSARLVVVIAVLATILWTGSAGAFALSSACAAIVAAVVGPPGARGAR